MMMRMCTRVTLNLPDQQLFCLQYLSQCIYLVGRLSSVCPSLCTALFTTGFPLPVENSPLSIHMHCPSKLVHCMSRLLVHPLLIEFIVLKITFRNSLAHKTNDRCYKNQSQWSNLFTLSNRQSSLIQYACPEIMFRHDELTHDLQLMYRTNRLSSKKLKLLQTTQLVLLASDVQQGPDVSQTMILF